MFMGRTQKGKDPISSDIGLDDIALEQSSNICVFHVIFFLNNHKKFKRDKLNNNNKYNNYCYCHDNYYHNNNHN